MHLINLHLNSIYSFYSSLIDFETLIKKAKEAGARTLVLTDTNLCGALEFYRRCLAAKISPVLGLEVEVATRKCLLLAKSWRGFQLLISFASAQKPLLISELVNTQEHLIIVDHPRLGFWANEKRVLEFENFYYCGSNKDDPRVVFVRENRLFDTAQNEALSVLLFTNSGQREKLKLEGLSFNVEGVAEEIVQRTNQLASSIDFRFPNFELDIAEFKGGGGIKRLKEQIKLGFKQKFNEFTNLEVAVARIKHETQIIDEMGMSDYFLIIWDLVCFAKKKGILIGPGRGSVTGSLVAYLLGITEVNPLRHGLFFERFLNHARNNFPDIDIDFEDERRQEVISYLHKTYGEDKVAQISAFQSVGSKNALRDVGRFLEIEESEVEGVVKWVDTSRGLEEQLEENYLLRNRVYSSTRNELLFNLAVSIYRLPRNISTHASGVVISRLPLNRKIPTFTTKEGRLQSQYTMNWLSDFGLIKIDVLGLKTLTMLRELLNTVKECENAQIDIPTTPTNFEAVFKLLTLGATMNIFQLESSGMRKTLQLVKPSNFEQLCDVLALYRPGPLKEIQVYAKRKNQTQHWSSISPEYEAILSDTFGVLIYQEQVMRICVEFAGLSNSEADLFREAISKKDESKITQLSLKLKGLLVEKGYNSTMINQIYSTLIQFASYGFNKAHTVAYALLSFKIAYIKARFPKSFYIWVLRNRSFSFEELQTLRTEATRLGVTFLGPLVNYPLLRKTSLEENSIVLPLKTIKGLSFRALKVIETRLHRIEEFTDVVQFVFYCIKDQLTKQEVLSIVRAGALREFVPASQILENYDYLWYICGVMLKTNVIERSSMVDFALIPQERNFALEAQAELAVLGGVYSSFPKSLLPQNPLILRAYFHFERIFLLISLEHFRSKRGKIFLKAQIFDGLSQFEMVVFDEVAKFQKMLQPFKFYKFRLKEWNSLLLLKAVVNEVTVVEEAPKTTEKSNTD